MNSLSLLFLTTLMTLVISSSETQQKQGPPATRRDPVVDTVHGVRIEDPYRWLQDQKSAETRAWIDEQNAYTQSLLGKRPGRDRISDRLGQLMKVDSIEVPLERNGRYFYRERRADQDLYVIRMREGGRDEVLIDPHAMSPDHTTSVALLDATKDGSLLAYGIRRGGADEMEVHVFDVGKRADRVDVLPTARYFQVSFKPDKSGLYYSLMGEDAPHIRYHALGAEPGKDTEVALGKSYGPEHIGVAEVSDDGHYLVMQVLYGAAPDKVDVFVQDLQKNGPVQPIVTDIRARFTPVAGGDHLFMETNWNAPNGRVLSVDLRDPAREHWREVVPESDAVISQVAAYGGRLAVVYLHNVSSQVKLFDAEGKPAGAITFPVLGTVSDSSGKWGNTDAFLQFSSFHVPPTIYRYDMQKNERSEWARVKVPVERSQFELKQVWYPSKDGTKIPMFLLYKKGMKLDGANPTLMTGYGGFDVSLTPEFQAQAVHWAEHGGLFAIPNLRGGSEFGEKWHRAGMMANKQNVFDDFISAAEWLIQNHYTNPSKLAIEGRSNGGLLVGAAMTQRPDLYQAVICGYPLLDMIRYQNFLVAKFWVPEYGSSENAEQFKYLYAYSPYHRVKQGTKYPAVMFVTGDADTRVAPLHARKMAALLQSATGSDKPVLMHYDTKSGHSEGRPVTKQIEDLTDELTFLFWQLGVNP